MRIIAHIASRILGSGLSAPSQCNGQHRRCLRRGIRGEIDLHGAQKKEEFHRRLPPPRAETVCEVWRAPSFSPREGRTRVEVLTCARRARMQTLFRKGARVQYTSQRAAWRASNASAHSFSGRPQQLVIGIAIVRRAAIVRGTERSARACGLGRRLRCATEVYR
jgi:hypothetical protein